MSINKSPYVIVEPVKQHLEYTDVSGYHMLSFMFPFLFLFLGSNPHPTHEGTFLPNSYSKDSTLLYSLPQPYC